MSDTPRRSGWCPPDQRHDSACRVCEMRQKDGLIERCDCDGHEEKEAQ